VHPVRFNILPPEKGSLVGGQPPVIYPDGLKIAFVAHDSTGASYIWVRPLSTITPTRLPGTNDATYPFWSPDSRTIGLFQGGKMKKIEAAGAPVKTLADAPDGRGGTWNSEGVIIFAPNSVGGLSQ